MRWSACVRTLLSWMKVGCCFKVRCLSCANMLAKADRYARSLCRWSPPRVPSDDPGGIQERLGAAVAVGGSGAPHPGGSGVGDLPVRLLRYLASGSGNP